MAFNRRVFVLGGHITPFIGKKHPDFIWKRHPEFGKRENPTLEETISAAVNGALNATGTPAELVDKAWIGNFVGELFSNQGHLGAAVVGSNPGLMYKPVMRVEGACASGGLAMACAVDAIQAGGDVTLVVGAEIQTTASARTGGDYLARASHYARQRELDDFTFPALFAWRNKHILAQTETTEEDIGRVSVKAYANANKNEKAHMKAVSLDLATAREAGPNNPNFLANEELAPFMKMSDCSQVSDGGAGLILVSEDGLRKLGKTPADATELVSLAQVTGNLYDDGNPLRMDATANALSKVYAGAGITAKDLQVAEVHDCFAITELLMYEAMGLAKPGKGFQLVREGRTDLTGDIPVNTGGGLIGFGHPVGATGVKQVLEIHRQMRGECGAYQLANKPTLGATVNMGGNDKTVVATVLRAP